MKNIKKILAVLLAVLMIGSIGVVIASAAEDDYILLKDSTDTDLNDGDWIINWRVYVMEKRHLSEREVKEQNLDSQIEAQIAAEKEGKDFYYSPERRVFRIESHDGSTIQIIGHDNGEYYYLFAATSQYSSSDGQSFSFSTLWSKIVTYFQWIIDFFKRLTVR